MVLRPWFRRRPLRTLRIGHHDLFRPRQPRLHPCTGPLRSAWLRRHQPFASRS